MDISAFSCNPGGWSTWWRRVRGRRVCSRGGWGGPSCCLPLPNVRLQSRWSQALEEQTARTSSLQHETLQYEKAIFTMTVIQHWEAEELAPLDVFKSQQGMTLSSPIQPWGWSSLRKGLDQRTSSRPFQPPLLNDSSHASAQLWTYQ